MNGDEYRQHKAIYASGMQILADALDDRMYGQQERIEAAAEIKLLLSATGGVVIVIAWIYLAHIHPLAAGGRRAARHGSAFLRSTTR